MTKLKISPRVAPSLFKASPKGNQTVLSEYPEILPKIDTNLNRYPSPRPVDLSQDQPTVNPIVKHIGSKPNLSTLARPNFVSKKIPLKQSTDEISKIISDARLVEQKTNSLINMRTSKQSSVVTDNFS